MSSTLRWLLFALIAAAGILALVDRQIIAVLKPTIATDLKWTDDDYGTLAAWFQGATAVSLLGVGPLIDRLGVRRANVAGVFGWSLAAILHGWAHSLFQFLLCRIALGATEAAVTPTGLKTMSVIFPPRMRSTAVGLSNAVASVGAILSPFLIPMIAAPFGWRGAYVFAGAAGGVWILTWVLATRKVRLFEETPALPSSTQPKPRGLPIDRRVWAVSIAKLLSDSTWWLMLFWMPDFLDRQFHLSGLQASPYLAIAYSGAMIGSIVAGGLASFFLARGVPVDRVRKLAMLISGIMALPLPLALLSGTPLGAALLLGLVLAAHQGFSTNLFALIADITPADRVGQMTSFSVFAGNIGGVAMQKVTGLVLAASLGYLPLFLFAAISYLLALAWVQLMLPTIRAVEPSGQVGEASQP